MLPAPIQSSEQTSSEQQFGESRQIQSVPELLAALQAPGVKEIVVSRTLSNVPAFRLQPGQRLCGAGNLTAASLQFADGSDGIELTTDNLLFGLRVVVQPHRLAIHNASDSQALGRMVLRDVATVGRVSIVVAKQQGKAHVEVRGLQIEAADAREAEERPSGYGVTVLQGAFTLWNRRTANAGVMTADLLDIAVGSMDLPVQGSGVFVCGAGHEDVSLHVQRLRTREVYSNGGIPAGTADVISGGVFVVYGASVDAVENAGPVATFGSNDMALDNWGRVDRWIACEKISTFGPSAIGFVNFGVISLLLLRAAIETHGTGARGFNVYSGTVERAEFDRIETRGDGAVAVQISQPIGTLSVQRGIRTHGGVGQSLVKGVVQELSAIALSIRPGGSAQEICVKGGLYSRGHNIQALEQAGEVQRFVIEGGCGNVPTVPSAPPVLSVP